CKAEIVGDLGKSNGASLNSSGNGHKGIQVLGRVDQVEGLDKIHIRNLHQVGNDPFQIGLVGVDACSDSGTAHIQSAHLIHGLIHTVDIPHNGYRVSMEFLAETDGNRVLHLGPSHFDHMVEFRRLVAEGFMQAEKFFFQSFQQPERRHFSGGGDHVVGGLAAVYVIVGVDQRIIAFFAAQDLDGPVGDDFVGVHVQGGAGAALDRIHDKIVMEFSWDDLVAGLDNGGGSLFIKNSDLAVGDGRSFFYVCQAVDDLGMHVKACNRKVLRGAEGLYSVVNV